MYIWKNYREIQIWCQIPLKENDIKMINFRIKWLYQGIEVEEFILQIKPINFYIVKTLKSSLKTQLCLVQNYTASAGMNTITTIEAGRANWVVC